MKSDLELQREVLDELEWELNASVSDIGVSVETGVITLAGCVDDPVEKWLAERAANRVPGVRAVANDIEVKLPSDGERSDSDIAHTAASALEWDDQVPHDLVKIVVSGGWITLEGNLESEIQKAAAEEAVRNLTGVKGVNNLITVTLVEAEEIEEYESRSRDYSFDL
jgi:osmotically-inducible protein OsmY